MISVPSNWLVLAFRLLNESCRLLRIFNCPSTRICQICFSQLSSNDLKTTIFRSIFKRRHMSVHMFLFYRRVHYFYFCLLEVFATVSIKTSRLAIDIHCYRFIHCSCMEKKITDPSFIYSSDYRLYSYIIFYGIIFFWYSCSSKIFIFLSTLLVSLLFPSNHGPYLLFLLLCLALISVLSLPKV